MIGDFAPDSLLFRILLIGREMSGRFWLFGEAWIIHTDGRIRTVLTPPLNHLLEKRVFRSSSKEVAVEIACLGIKQNKYRHRRVFW